MARQSSSTLTSAQLEAYRELRTYYVDFFTECSAPTVDLIPTEPETRDKPRTPAVQAPQIWNKKTKRNMTKAELAEYMGISVEDWRAAQRAKIASQTPEPVKVHGYLPKQMMKLRPTNNNSIDPNLSESKLQGQVRLAAKANQVRAIVKKLPVETQKLLELTFTPCANKFHKTFQSAFNVVISRDQVVAHKTIGVQSPKSWTIKVTETNVPVPGERHNLTTLYLYQNNLSTEYKENKDEQSSYIFYRNKTKGEQKQLVEQAHSLFVSLITQYMTTKAAQEARLQGLQGTYKPRKPFTGTPTHLSNLKPLERHAAPAIKGFVTPPRGSEELECYSLRKQFKL